MLFAIFVLISVIYGQDTPKPCDDQWFSYGTSQYKVISESWSFDIAMTRCERMGASLFVANSMEEYEFVRSRLFSLNSSSEHFIGMAILGGDCEPKWQMPHGLPIDILPWGNNSRSRHLRRWNYVPVAYMTSSTGSLRFVNCEDMKTSKTAVCERNASYVGYSAKELEVIFFNSSNSRQTEKRYEGYARFYNLRLLAAHFMHWLIDIEAKEGYFDYESQVSRIASTMRRMNPEIYDLSLIDLKVSERVYMADWIFNYILLNDRKPPVIHGCKEP